MFFMFSKSTERYLSFHVTDSEVSVSAGRILRTVSAVEQKRLKWAKTDTGRW
jgi:hypothetical protein